MSLLTGIIFYHLGVNQLAIRDRFSLIFLMSALYPFMVILDTISRFCDERPQVRTQDFRCEHSLGSSLPTGLTDARSCTGSARMACMI